MKIRPSGDVWRLVGTDPNKVGYGSSFTIDFSDAPSDELKRIYKEFVWHNYVTESNCPRTLADTYCGIRHFNEFLRRKGITSLVSLNVADVDDFQTYLRIMPKPGGGTYAMATQKGFFSSVKTLIRWCSIHMPDLAPKKAVFVGRDYPGTTSKKAKVEYIPDMVIEQVNRAISHEENPLVKHGLTILKCTGMRSSEIVRLRVDCLSYSPLVGHTMVWRDWKSGRNRDPVPVPKECAEAVEKLIEATSGIRERASARGRDLLMIYEMGRRAGKEPDGPVHVLTARTYRRWIADFVERNGIVGEDGEPYRLEIHRFRRTLGTDMLSQGTDVLAAQKMLGHADYRTTLRFYATVKEKERAETFSRIGIIGDIAAIEEDVFDDASEKEWFLANIHTKAQMEDGWCTRPFDDGEICERLLSRKKCYTCSRYITTPEYLEEHRRYRDSLIAQLADNASLGAHYEDHIRPLVETLNGIIARLEEVENGIS